MKHPEILLIPALIIINLGLARYNASLAEGYRARIKLEHLELNPIWQVEGRKFKFRMLLYVVGALLTTAGLLLLAQLAPTTMEAPLRALLGFYFTVLGVRLGQNLSNLLTFRYVERKPAELSGHVALEHSFVLSQQLHTTLAISVPIALIAIFSPSPFVLGALVAMLALGLRQLVWLRLEWRRKARAAAAH